VTPREADIRALAGWLNTANQPVFATNRLSELYQPAAAYKSIASGVLAVRLSLHAPEFLLWFRPEHIEIVNWAGDPKKPVKVSEPDGEIRLSPPTSLARWNARVMR